MIADQPLVSIVIPTYNRKEKLIRLIDSILKSTYRNLEIIVVDDVSTDGTYNTISNIFSQIKVIRNDKEKLLAGSRNVGILHSNGDLIFLIDDDNIIADNTISELIMTINSNSYIGIAQPIMYYFEQPNKIWCAGVKRNMTTSLTKLIGRDQTDDGQFSTLIESMDSPNVFMIKREIIKKIGLFDNKNFPIHYDEADFGERVRNAGYRIICDPGAKVWHDIPVYEDIEDTTRFFHIHNEFRAYYAARNRILFHKKYSKRLQFLIFIFMFNPLFALYYSVLILKSKKISKEKISIIRCYLTGIMRGLYG